MRLWEGMPRSGAPPEPRWELSSPPDDVVLARALRPESSCESAAPWGCPLPGREECQAVHLPDAFPRPPLGISGRGGLGGAGPHLVF